ncbi:dnaJsubfamily C member 14-like [Arapaima gigas]
MFVKNRPNTEIEPLPPRSVRASSDRKWGTKRRVVRLSAANSEVTVEYGDLSVTFSNARKAPGPMAWDAPQNVQESVGLGLLKQGVASSVKEKIVNIFTPLKPTPSLLWSELKVWCAGRSHNMEVASRMRGWCSSQCKGSQRLHTRWMTRRTWNWRCPTHFSQVNRRTGGPVLDEFGTCEGVSRREEEEEEVKFFGHSECEADVYNKEEHRLCSRNEGRDLRTHSSGERGKQGQSGPLDVAVHNGREGVEIMGMVFLCKATHLLAMKAEASHLLQRLSYAILALASWVSGLKLERLLALAHVPDDEQDPFAVVGVEADATDPELKRPYGQLAILEAHDGVGILQIHEQAKLQDDVKAATNTVTCTRSEG